MAVEWAHTHTVFDNDIIVNDSEAGRTPSFCFIGQVGVTSRNLLVMVEEAAGWGREYEGRRRPREDPSLGVGADELFQILEDNKCVWRSVHQALRIGIFPQLVKFLHKLLAVAWIPAIDGEIVGGKFAGLHWTSFVHMSK